MKKVLVVFGAILLSIAILIVALHLHLSEDLPVGTEGPEADALALEVMSACNGEAWSQTRYVAWTFAGINSYIWDRSLSLVQLNTKNGSYIIDSSTGTGVSRRSTGVNTISAEDAEETWAKFCNDSFWLIAPLKLFDPGTRREIVNVDEGRGLVVHFEQGGVTPGDSYLWLIAEDGLPYAMEMWTQFPPLNGLRTSWTDWQQLHTGAMVATTHMIGKINVSISELRSGSDLSQLGIEKDPFL